MAKKKTDGYLQILSVVDEPSYWKTHKEQNIKKVEKIKEMLQLLVSYITTEIKKTFTIEKREKGAEINKMYLELVELVQPRIERGYYRFYEWTHNYNIGDPTFKSYNLTFSGYINDVFMLLLINIFAPISNSMEKQKIRKIMESNKKYMNALIKILVSDPDNQQVKEKIHEIINISTDFAIFDNIMPVLESINKKKNEIEDILKEYRNGKITEDELGKQLKPKQEEMDILKKNFDEVTKSINVDHLPPQEVPPDDVIEQKEKTKKKGWSGYLGLNGGKRRRSTKRKTKRSKRKQKRNTKRRASHRRRR